MLHILQRNSLVHNCRKYRYESSVKTGSDTISQLSEIISKLTEQLKHKDEIMNKKDKIFLQTAQKSMEQSDTIGELKVDLNNARQSLKEVTTKFLVSTCSLHMYSVFEIFRNRFIINNGWQEFVSSDSSVAVSFKSDLDNASINVKHLNDLAGQLYSVLSTDIHKAFKSNSGQLYSVLSTDIHKAFKSNSTLFIVKDHLTFDQLHLMMIIANFVVDSDYIQVVSEDQWEAIYEKFKLEASLV